jgi:hypothetical protein
MHFSDQASTWDNHPALDETLVANFASYSALDRYLSGADLIIFPRTRSELEGVLWVPSFSICVPREPLYNHLSGGDIHTMLFTTPSLAVGPQYRRGDTAGYVDHFLQRRLSH